MRDDFDARTKKVLADRVNSRCSRPDCGKATSGPQEDPTKALNIGVAAHITAASEGGPRYDPSLSSEERGSVDNGLWLCQNCAKLIDSDVQRYSPELLREWKRQAEQRAQDETRGIGQDQHAVDEEFVAFGLFDEKIRLLSLTKDGKWEYLDQMSKIHRILYVATSETLAMLAAVEELEALMNDPKASELAFQDFFERNPRFILNDEYKRAHSHITLVREEGPLIPDFLLEPIDQNALCDILELKLPSTKIFVLKKSRMRFSAAVFEACAQLREYSSYFDDKENRDLIHRTYRLMAYKPKMIVIIGRRGDVDPIAVRGIETDLPRLILRTYDDVLNRARARLEL
jgi:hypothetical protein